VAARLVAVAVISMAASQSANAGFVDFVIRGDSAGGISPAINDLGSGAQEFVISLPGQKAGLGSNDINGSTLGQIQSLSITRTDDRTRFAVGSGPYAAPYLNFWITDGLGNFAVVSNEPTNPVFQPLYHDGYNLSFADLSGTPAWIYENSNKSWLPNNGVDLHFSDLTGFRIQAPTAAQLGTGWTGLTSGAPRELGTNQAYGVNWVFGDTLSNYMSGQPGYVVSGASAGAVPEPGTCGLMLAALGVLGAISVRRREQRVK
jgi:hypothetical protein